MIRKIVNVNVKIAACCMVGTSFCTVMQQVHAYDVLKNFVVKLSMFYKFPLKCNVYSAFLFLLYDVFCSQNIYSREYFQLMWFQEISVAKDSTYTI